LILTNERKILDYKKGFEMKIYVIGDIHGGFEFLPNILKDVHPSAFVVQVGDFGVYREYKSRWEKVVKDIKQHIFFIDGNHEEFPLFYDPDRRVPLPVWPQLTWIPRGTVLEVNGYRIGFMGGAASVDKALRTEGLDWWPQEVISYGEFERMLKNEGPIDLLITHTPPQRIISRRFRHPSMVAPSWRLSPDWIDWSAVAVEKIWDHFDNPDLICGHFHSSFKDENCRALDINELVVWEG